MFSIMQQSENGFDKIILKDNQTETIAEIIPACSAMLHAFKVVQNKVEVNVIESYASLDDFTKNVVPKGFRGCKLSPFVCRVKNSTYQFGEKKYHIQKSLPAKDALHGQLYDKPFEVTHQEQNDNYASVSMKYSYKKEDEGYPFSYDCIVTWKLEKNNSLSVLTECVNKDDGLIPMQDGWHPYFTLGVPIEQLSIEFQSMEILEFDERLMPTGKLTEYDTFNSLKKIGNTVFDNCFTLNLDTCQPMCVLKNTEQKIQLEIYPESSYPYLQIYTPDSRKSIAIENISGAPDAINNGMGLQVIESGKSAVYKVTYKISLTN